jgi:hypothetical protein
MKTIGEAVGGAPAPEQQAPPAELPTVTMLVDVRDGSFEPVLGDAGEVQPGPFDIVMEFSQAGGMNIVAQGAQVTPDMLANLSSPEAEPKQPKLKEGFQVPEGFEGVAEALGV